MDNALAADTGIPVAARKAQVWSPAASSRAPPDGSGKDRMEVTGARWSLDGAEAVLKLRALAGNGDFDDYFAFHLKQRDHDSRYQQPQPAAA